MEILVLLRNCQRQTYESTITERLTDGHEGSLESYFSNSYQVGWAERQTRKGNLRASFFLASVKNVTVNVKMGLLQSS